MKLSAVGTISHVRLSCWLVFCATISHAQYLQVGNLAAARFDAEQRAVISPGTLINIAPDPRTLANSVIDTTKSLSVKIQSGGAEVEAQVMQSSPYGVIAVAPSTIPLGTGQLSFSYTGIRGDGHILQAAINVVSSSFDLFSGVAQNINADGAQVNRPESPARPGQFITLWGTGLGTASLADVSVLLAGKPVEPSFAAHDFGLPGVDQINFQIPDDPEIPDGCSVAVAVKVRSRLSSIGVLAKTSTGAPCYYLPQYGLSDSQRTGLDAGRLPFGYIERTNAQGIGAFFAAWAEFGTLDATEFVSQFPPIFASGYRPACVDNPLLRPEFNSIESVGDTITLSGQGQSFNIGHTPDPAYSNGYSFISNSTQPGIAGDWQISIPGQGTIPAFRVNVHLPPAIDVANLDQLKMVSRSSGFEVLWNPSGYSDRDTVEASLDRAAGFGSPGFNVGCSAAAADGSLTMPASILGDVPTDPGPVYLTVRLMSSSISSIPVENGASMLVLFRYLSQNSAGVGVF